MKRRRVREAATWVSAVAAAMVLVGGIASFVWTGSVWMYSGGREYKVTGGLGTVWVMCSALAQQPAASLPGKVLPRSSWRFDGEYARLGPRPGLVPWLPEWSVNVGLTRWRLGLPLWIPVVLLGAPAAFLLWSDRRVPAGHCRKCRFDLAGLAEGAACPECGAKAVPP